MIKKIGNTRYDVTKKKQSFIRILRPLEITYDPEVDAAYIYFFKPKVMKACRKHQCEKGTVEVDVPGGDSYQIGVDFDHDGKMYGVEVLNATKYFPPLFLSTQGQDKVLQRTGYALVYKARKRRK